MCEEWVNEAEMIDIAKALINNISLKILDVSYTRLGDVGANAFVDMFKSNTTLKELLLGGNLIHAEGALAIIEVLRHNTTITELYIGHIPEKIRDIIRRNRAL